MIISLTVNKKHSVVQTNRVLHYRITKRSLTQGSTLALTRSPLGSNNFQSKVDRKYLTDLVSNSEEMWKVVERAKKPRKSNNVIQKKYFIF